MAKTYGTVTTFTAGSVLTATQLNTASTAINNLVVPAMVHVSRTANQTGLTHNGTTAISWQTSSGTGDFDTDSMWAAGSPTLITFNTPGVYLVTLNVYVGFTTAPNNIQVSIEKSDGSVAIASQQIPGVATYLNQYSVSALVSSTSYSAVRGTVSIGSGSGSGAYVRYDNGSNFQAVWIGRTS